MKHLAPPSELIKPQMADLFRYMKDKTELTLIRSCVFHYELEFIHPFMDGNKRTSRIVSNALLMSQKHCPLSFRTVDSMAYKKAMLLFYEQNNLSNFKKMFIDQFEFATRTYF